MQKSLYHIFPSSFVIVLKHMILFSAVRGFVRVLGVLPSNVLIYDLFKAHTVQYVELLKDLS